MASGVNNSPRINFAPPSNSGFLDNNSSRDSEEFMKVHMENLAILSEIRHNLEESMVKLEDRVEKSIKNERRVHETTKKVLAITTSISILLYVLNKSKYFSS